MGALESVSFSYGWSWWNITGYYRPAVEGRTYGPPEDCYPSEEAEFEMYEIVKDGVEYVPETQDEVDALEEYCILAAVEQAKEDEDRAVDDYIDGRRDWRWVDEDYYPEY